MAPGYGKYPGASPLRRMQNEGAITMTKCDLLLFFSKRDEKNNLICRVAVKLEGRSPESKR
ncbi:MAG: hypothetical protein IJ599_03960 [Alphaproteobacteria bacterium]|nr:hypothetical protein [Alphaproteobacteria bacterium]